MSTKSRDLDQVVAYPPVMYRESGKKPWRVANLASPSQDRFRGRQFTVSSGNRKNPRTGKYESGGPFFTTRVEPQISQRSANLYAEISSNGEAYKYNGPITIPAGLTSGSDYSGTSLPSPDDDTHLDKYGAEAIAIVDPTNSNAATGVALGEILHDRRISLPGISAWKKRTEVAKAAGSEYLAAQFGWLPLVSDMKDTAQSIRDGNRIMENYNAAAGTYVHREFAFDDIVEESEFVGSQLRHASYSGAGGGSFGALHSGLNAVINTHVKKVTKRWFSGAFTYANADRSTIQKCLGIGAETDKLFGLTLTPDVVWELTPWSWAIDWFSNAGPVLSNVTSFGLAGLVMRYGYMMEETTIVTTYSMSRSGLNGDPGPPPSSSVISTTKRRRPANPFGFGVGWEGLSPTQLAITAALGITRLR